MEFNVCRLSAKRMQLRWWFDGCAVIVSIIIYILSMIACTRPWILFTSQFLEDSISPLEFSSVMFGAPTSPLKLMCKTFSTWLITTSRVVGD